MTLDSSIVVYLFDKAAPAKRETARALVNMAVRREAPLGIQVAGELQNAMRRKLRYPAFEAAQSARNLLAGFSSFAPTRDAAFKALADQASGLGQYWDRLLIYSAAEVGCTAIITEDAQGADHIGGVEIVPAFGSDGEPSRRALDLLET